MDTETRDAICAWRWVVRAEYARLFPETWTFQTREEAERKAKELRRRRSVSSVEVIDSAARHGVACTPPDADDDPAFSAALHGDAGDCVDC